VRHPATRQRKAGQCRAAGQREMLLPIAGKGTAKEPAKEKTKEPASPVIMGPAASGKG